MQQFISECTDYSITIGIKVDGVRPRLECSDEKENVESMEFGGGIKMKKTTKKVQICSKVKINDFWSILTKMELSMLSDAQI